MLIQAKSNLTAGQFKKLSPGIVAGKVLSVFFLFISIYPVFWLVLSSFKTRSEFTLSPSYALPKSLFLDNYINAWTAGRIGMFFKNSVICTLTALVFIVIFSTTASFALAKMKWGLRNTVTNIFQFGIMVPTSVVLIPLFNIYKNTGWLNTRFCLIITYIAFGLTLSVFLMMSYLKSFTDELMEAAVIDGCNIYQLMWYVVVPLLKTCIVTVLVLQFYFRWNDLIFSMTFVSKTELKTLQTGLLYFSDMYGSRDWGSIFASIAISILPTIALYFSLNKLVINGMTAGAIKG